VRIASLLPAATETVAALGLTDQLVGVTHECDYPEAVRALPKLTQSLLPSGMTSAEIDAAVTRSQHDDHTIYALDAELLARLQPDFVLTQSLCEVCAVPRSTVDEAVCSMPQQARVLSLDPSSVEDMLADIERVGEELGCRNQAATVVSDLKARVSAVREGASAVVSRPRVFCAEWLDPIFCAGHWIPEMVSIAGGEEALGRAFTDSVRVDWQAVQAWAPEVLIMMPCGFDAAGALSESKWMTERPGWRDLPAVRSGRVFVVDANAYFARPGPRLIDGVEVLARLMHPDVFTLRLTAGIAYKLKANTVDEFEPYE
jgi:iron complex transport system substrate-binding protein